MPRTSLTALEIVLRQTADDPELAAYPDVRANVRTFIRSLRKQRLDQEQETIALGEVHDRRFLLLAIPTGAVKTADGMNTVLRVQEAVVKARNARRRKTETRRAVPTARDGQRRQIPTAGRSQPMRYRNEDPADAPEVDDAAEG